MIRWVAVWWVLVGGVLFGCTCAPSTACGAYNSAEVVVMVRIDRILEFEHTSATPFATKAEGRVVKSWKGDLPEGMQIRVTATPWCNFALLKPGGDLLYYGRRQTGSEIDTAGCGRKGDAAYASSDLRYLASVEAARRLPQPLAVMLERWAALQECLIKPVTDGWRRR